MRSFGIRLTSLLIVASQCAQLLAADGARAQEAPDNTAKSADLETIVVTGTNIRGVENKTEPLLKIDREAIDRSGYDTTQQLFDTLPQNFSGGQTGVSETGLLGIGAGSAANISNASGINLRGLGTTSTLVLMDGHRVVASAFGTAVDVSLIPLGAIERVDILTDGASAIYGSDAVAGVVNFVMRKDFDGAQTTVRAGTATDRGSTKEELISQLYGHNWDSGNILVNFQARHRNALPSADRDFTATAAQPTDLLPRTDDQSLLLNAHQFLSSNLEAFFEGNYTHKTSNRYLSVFGPPASSTNNSDLTNNYNFNGGLAYQLSTTWRVELSATYSDEKDRTAYDYAIGAPLGYTNGEPANVNDTHSLTEDLKADGALFSLPGGEVHAALGASHRSEGFISQTPYIPATNRFDRHVSAGFGELYIPLFGPDNAVPMLQKLDLSAAIRYDDYSDFGATTNPRFGLYWKPIEYIGLRASYSTSFRAPDAYEEAVLGAQGQGLLVFPFVSPTGGIAPVFVLAGTSPNLRPETAQNLSFGGDFSVPSIKGLKFSVDYYHIDFRNRITQPPLDTAALLHPDVYGSLITPLASDAAALAYLQSQIAQHVLYVDFLGTGATGVRDIFDWRQANAARVRQEGMDFNADYAFQVSDSHFDVSANASLINEILTSFASTSVPTNTMNTYGNPLGLRFRTSLNWSWHALSTTGAVNYAGSYRDTTVVPTGRVGAWTTADLNIRFAPTSWHGLSVSASVQNLFNSLPPRTGSELVPGIDYDVANANPLGRFVALELRKIW